MSRMTLWLALLASLLLSPAAADAEKSWPQFRGPSGEGHSVARGVPLAWSETKNVTWKVAVPGLGWSSPAIAHDQIWLTTALDGGRSLRALCFDAVTGKLVHNVEVFQKDDPGEIHSKNSHASPTPVVDNGHVYVHYGAHGTACLTTDGQIVWKTVLKYNHRHGPGGSPVVFEDLLIVSCDGTDVAYIVALDKQTGDVRWKKDRDGPMAYSTPLVIEAAGRTQLISTGGDQVVSYDPRTGEELWRSRYDGYSLIPRPVYGHGLVFICTGYNTPTVQAIRPDGRGDVTETHVRWTLKRGAPHSPSPVLVGDELYLVSDRGIATCVDAKSGEIHWQERLEGAYSASPLYVDGRIYFTNESGKTTVIAPGRQFGVLAEHQIDGRTLASLAVYGRALFQRSDQHLYRIESPGQ